MSEDSEDKFSRTTLWQKSLADEKTRANSWIGKTTLILLSLGAVVAFVAFGYLVSR
ncbi:MAG: hypothetical protein V4709_04855 [Pseudomonadota bacterium]